VRFPIRFTGFNRSMVVLGILPSRSYVDVGDGEVRVQLGWAFALRCPRSSVRGVSRYEGRVYGWGAHGWRGEWLVNGSSKGIVRVELEPRARGRVTFWPLRVHTLLVAVEDPDGLMAALG
jgi:hypothetical protein